MKTAIVGLGIIGSVHYEVLKDLNMDVVALCDVNEEKLNNYSGVQGFTDYLTMLDAVKPDVVHICTPHYLHKDMIVWALERDVNVLCEKPMCISREEIDEILEAEKRSKAKLGVCHQNRFNPENIFVKNYLKNKEIVAGQGSVVWHRDAEYYHSADWRGKRETEGGGVLINQALHTLDLMQWIYGMPSKVSAVCANLTLSEIVEVEDTAFAVFSDGADFCFVATNGGKVDFSIEMTFKTKDGETVRITPQSVLINGSHYDFKKNSQPYAKCCYGTGHKGLISNFYDCLENGKSFEIDGKEAAKVIRLILSTYESKGENILVK